MTKDQYVQRCNAYVGAFRTLASSLSSDDPMVPFLGSLAWGRYDAEFFEPSLKSAAVAYGFLWGCERMVVSWCNVNDRPTTRNLFLDAVKKGMQ